MLGCSNGMTSDQRLERRYSRMDQGPDRASTGQFLTTLSGVMEMLCESSRLERAMPQSASETVLVKLVERKWLVTGLQGE